MFVNAIMYYKVRDATLAVSRVDDYGGSSRLLSATTLRNVLGTKVPEIKKYFSLSLGQLQPLEKEQKYSVILCLIFNNSVSVLEPGALSLKLNEITGRRIDVINVHIYPGRAWRKS